jgi:hypothetical protein
MRTHQDPIAVGCWSKGWPREQRHALGGVNVKEMSGPLVHSHSSSLPFHLLSSLAISLFISLFSIHLGYLSIWIHPGREVYLVLQMTPSLFPPLIPLIYLAIRSYLFRLPIYSVVLSQSSLISLAPSALSFCPLTPTNCSEKPIYSLHIPVLYIP